MGYITNFPNGVSSFGNPSSGNRFSNPWSTHYFVDGDNGNDSFDGLSPTTAFKTIQGAVTAATGGDVIYIRPKTYTLGTGFARYTEDVSVTLGGSGGSGATATNAGISLIGITPLGQPSDFLGVRWKYTSATPLTVDAPALHIENIGFFTEAATYAINFRNNGATRTQDGSDGPSIYNCAIKGDGKIYLQGGAEAQIINCRFQAKYDGTTGGLNLGIGTVTLARTTVVGCDFIGGNGNAMATAPITFTGLIYDFAMRDCYFGAAPTAGQYMTGNPGTGQTGYVSNCYFASDDAKSALTMLVTRASGMVASGLHDENGELDFSS